MSPHFLLLSSTFLCELDPNYSLPTKSNLFNPLQPHVPFSCLLSVENPPPFSKFAPDNISYKTFSDALYLFMTFIVF